MCRHLCMPIQAEANFVQIARRFDAPVQRVFDAWVNPAIACKWLFKAPSSENADFDFDVRVGGRWKIADPLAASQYAATGEYLAIDAPRFLVFTLVMPEFSERPDLVTVRLTPDGEGCILTLIEKGVTPDAATRLANGWNGMLDDLVKTLN